MACVLQIFTVFGGRRALVGAGLSGLGGGQALRTEVGLARVGSRME